MRTDTHSIVPPHTQRYTAGRQRLVHTPTKAWLCHQVLLKEKLPRFALHIVALSPSQCFRWLAAIFEVNESCLQEQHLVAYWGYGPKLTDITRKMRTLTMIQTILRL
eukprot:6468223-Amphidinium_carterae.2